MILRRFKIIFPIVIIAPLVILAIITSSFKISHIKRQNKIAELPKATLKPEFDRLEVFVAEQACEIVAFNAGFTNMDEPIHFKGTIDGETIEFMQHQLMMRCEENDENILYEGGAPYDTQDRFSGLSMSKVPKEKFDEALMRIKCCSQERKVTFETFTF
ncbi:hypothetical protein ACFL96_19495 [Thermoproteota archaeon]